MLLLAASLTIAASAGTARAQEAPAAARGPSDLQLRAIGDQPAALRLQDGSEVYGRVMATDGEALVVRVLATDQLVNLPRASVVGIYLRQPPRAQPDREAPGGGPPPKERYFAIQLSVAPGVAFDFDYRLFHAFANVGVVLPLAYSGETVPFSFGAGLGIPVSPRHPRLRLDLFAFMAAIFDGKNRSNGGDVGLGVGLGLHHTWRNGLTLGFTVPVLGYSVRTTGSARKIGEATGYFYLASAVGLPLGFIGYRF